MFRYKYVLVLICFCLTIAVNGNEYDRSVSNKDFYTRIGLNIPTHRSFTGSRDFIVDFDLGMQLAAGWNFHKYMSVEIEGDYFALPISYPRSSGGNNRTLKSLVGFANFIAHPLLIRNSNFKPFIGAGVGCTRNIVGRQFTNLGLDAGRPSNSSVHFAYQAFLGMEYAIRPHLSIIADFRFLNLGKGFIQIAAQPFVNTGWKGFANKLTLQTLNLGMKYKF